MVARIFVVLAAVLFVASAALASIGGPMMPLAEGLRQFDSTSLAWLDSHVPVWLARWVLGPLMVRPVWLLPVCLGVVSLGLAASLNSMRGTPLRRKG